MRFITWIAEALGFVDLERKRAILWLLPLVAFFLVFVFPIFLVNSKTWFYYTDTFWPYYPVQANYDMFWTSWGPFIFGGINRPSLYGTLLTPIFQLFGSAIATRITFSLTSVGSITMYYFLYKTRLIVNGPIRILGSLLYGFNWLTLEHQNLYLMATTGYMLMYAMAPLIALFLFRILFKRERLLYNSFGLGISLAIASLESVIVIADLSLVILVILASSLLTNHYTGVTIRARAKSFAAIAFSFGLYFLLLLPLLYSYLADVISKGIVGGLQAQYQSKIALTPYHNSFYIGWYEQTFPSVVSALNALSGPTFDGFLPLLGALSFLIILLPVVSRTDRERTALSFGFLGGAIIITSYITLLIAGNPLVGMLWNAPILKILLGAYLTPTQVLLPLVIFLGFAAVLGFSQLERLIVGKIHRFRLPKKILGMTLMVLLVSSATLSNGYLVFGYTGLFQPISAVTAQGGSHVQPDNYIPSYFFQLEDFFNSERASVGPFRVFWFPEGNPQYISIIPQVDPMSYFYPPTSEVLLDQWSQAISSFHLNETSGFSQFLGSQNVRYIVLLNDYDQSNPVGTQVSGVLNFIQGSPDSLNALLRLDPRFVQTASNANFTVYQNLDWDPMVYSASTVYATPTTTNPYNEFGALSQLQGFSQVIFDYTSGSQSETSDFPSYPQPMLPLPVVNNSLTITGTPNYLSARFQTVSFGLNAAQSYGTDFCPSQSNLEGFFVLPAYHSRSGSPDDNVTISLQSLGNGTSPVGATIATAQISAANWLQYATFESQQDANNMSLFQPLFIPMPYSGLSPVQKYALVFNTTGPPDNNNYFNMATRNGHPDSCGEDWYLGPTGAWLPYTDYNLWLIPVYNDTFPLASTVSSSSLPVTIESFSPFTSPSEYTIFTNFSAPAYIVLGQSYDPNWQATNMATGVTYTHFEANGWANGYFINETGPVTIQIRFGLQSSYDGIIWSWILISPVILVAFVLLSFGYDIPYGLRKRVLVGARKA
jgi:hypothetical protein